jgi:hypothetical protein
LQKGALVAHGEAQTFGTSFATTPTDRAEPLEATETAELFYVKLPTF